MIYTKKAVCYSMVKNEEDIIELFIRHNLKYFDHCFITDNNSSDNTVFIIKELIKEGFPITLWHDPTIAYEQSRITTEAYHRISKLMAFDLFFPLDADEIITIEDNFDINIIKNEPCYLINQANYVTTHPNDKTINMIRRYKQIGSNKIFINHDPNKYKDIVIEQGNHRIRYKGFPIAPVLIPNIRINHFGTRGLSHFLNKHIIGSQAMMILDENYLIGKSPLASHWYNQYLFIKQQKAKISVDDYIQNVLGIVSIEKLLEITVEEPLFEDTRLKYSENEINLVNNLISNFENLTYEYWKLKKSPLSSILTEYIHRITNYTKKRINTLKRSIIKRLKIKISI